MKKDHPGYSRPHHPTPPRRHDSSFRGGFIDARTLGTLNPSQLHSFLLPWIRVEPRNPPGLGRERPESGKTPGLQTFESLEIEGLRFENLNF